MKKGQGPVLIDIADQKQTKSKPQRRGQADDLTPDTAPPVPDLSEPPSGRAMQSAAALLANRPSRLARWFWRLLVVIVAFAVSVWAWDFATGLISRNLYLGYTITALLGLFVTVCAAIGIREWAAFSRLRRLDAIRSAAEAAYVTGDLGDARKVKAQLIDLYKGRPDLSWAAQNLAERSPELLDGDALLELTETTLLAPLDAAARREVEAAARQVATVTAIVPLALADVVAALVANLRMIRRVAELYGGRSGFLGGWRLTRTVLTHLVATGAVAVGDDLIGSIAGGGVLSKVSRRFGEGVINGALTARVGVAAMDVCRPLPFRREKPPSVTSLVQRSLTGLFSRTRD